MGSFMWISHMAELSSFWHGAVVAIGNFDGVHLGHQRVIKQAIACGKTYQKPVAVLSFEPHPRDFFVPMRPVDRLTPPAQKAEILSLLGCDGVVEQCFDRTFADLSAESFVEAVLYHGFQASAVVIGHDFSFGAHRGGNVATLKEMGAHFGFSVYQEPAFVDATGAPVSSSRIRSSLAKGSVEEAARLLNYYYRVQGQVCHGAKLGRQLGFPTVNMVLPAQTSLKYGIYAVRLYRKNGAFYGGVASFGRRPTVEKEGLPLLEIYIFDFDGDLYDEWVSVCFVSFLRDEAKFANLDQLKTQINQDCEAAKACLIRAQPLSFLDARLNPVV
ncbi:bifunctional riboflavin kinase/FAD synthetase [Bartonella sp. DGB2]|uniref:bifunctional riboflavin kinase/FAD synthetase n=1 Tax=Bartonella sp. DGB2 TaxID=3388426 RepID=UPI00398FF94D